MLRRLYFKGYKKNTKKYSWHVPTRPSQPLPSGALGVMGKRKARKRVLPFFIPITLCRRKVDRWRVRKYFTGKSYNHQWFQSINVQFIDDHEELKYHSWLFTPIFFVFIQTFSPEQENLATGFSNRNFLADGEIEIQENDSKPRDDGDGEEEVDLNQGNQWWARSSVIYGTYNCDLQNNKHVNAWIISCSNQSITLLCKIIHM